MTGESWHDLMFELAAQPTIDNQCKPRATYQDFRDAGEVPVGCGNAAVTTLFFVLYVFMVLIVLVNLFVAVTLQGYD